MDWALAGEILGIVVTSAVLSYLVNKLTSGNVKRATIATIIVTCMVLAAFTYLHDEQTSGKASAGPATTVKSSPPITDTPSGQNSASSPVEPGPSPDSATPQPPASRYQPTCSRHVTLQGIMGNGGNAGYLRVSDCTTQSQSTSGGLDTLYFQGVPDNFSKIGINPTALRASTTGASTPQGCRDAVENALLQQPAYIRVKQTICAESVADPGWGTEDYVSTVTWDSVSGADAKMTITSWSVS